MTTDQNTQTDVQQFKFGTNGNYIQTVNCAIFHADYGNRSDEEIARIQHSTWVLQQQYLASQQNYKSTAAGHISFIGFCIYFSRLLLYAASSTYISESSSIFFAEAPISNPRGNSDKKYTHLGITYDSAFPTKKLIHEILIA